MRERVKMRSAGETYDRRSADVEKITSYQIISWMFGFDLGGTELILIKKCLYQLKPCINTLALKNTFADVVDFWSSCSVKSEFRRTIYMNALCACSVIGSLSGQMQLKP